MGFPLAESPPVELHIPAIELHAEDLVELGLTPARTLQVPWDYDKAGWYTAGATPGALGPAVIAGHLDSVTAPAVFHRLHKLERGDTVEVRREEGIPRWQLRRGHSKLSGQRRRLRHPDRRLGPA